MKSSPCTNTAPTETSIREVVAHHLGVGNDALRGDVSLRDDLAVDSLDLIELATALEAEFAIDLPERTFDRVHTYRDLVGAIRRGGRARGNADENATDPSPHFWARMVLRGDRSRGTVERVGRLTPYAAETIAAAAGQAGRGTRLEVSVAARTLAGVARVRRRFARLGERGVRVIVRWGDRPPPLAFAHAAGGNADRLGRGWTAHATSMAFPGSAHVGVPIEPGECETR